ncbi:MAG: hypothetical protein HOP17_15455 [Acidobacteria bacterium]|nr:hypothetical protein [Acidobacteriota bacterium]
MKNRMFGSLAALIVIPLVFGTHAFGQLQNLPANLRRQSNNPDQEAYRQLQIQRTLDAQQRTAMRRAEEEARASAKVNETMPAVSAADLKRIERLLTPNAEDLDKYKAFLDLERTGIFKLFPQSVCDESRVVRLDGECANSVPGGSRYSFRAGSKTPDIHYVNGVLFAKGFFAHHLIANIGDVPVESLLTGDKYLKPLAGIAPSVDFEEARSLSSDIEDGLLLESIKYSDRAEILLNTTYLLRTIAYRNGNNLQRRLDRASPAADDPVRGFEKLQTDHRMDLIVAFRIIRKDEYGNLTIVWREISRKKAPVITFPEDQGMADFN